MDHLDPVEIITFSFLFIYFFVLTKYPDSLDRSSKEKEDKMNKFKQVAIKAKKELETHKKQV